MGVRLVADNRAQVLAELERRVTAVLETGAVVCQQEAIHAIQTGPRSGIVYDRGDRIHQASAEGEAPASDTTALESSITIERPSPLRRRVVVGEDYGAILELRMNRPFLLPAFYVSVPIMRAMLRDIQRAGGWRAGRPLRRSIHYRSQATVRKT